MGVCHRYMKDPDEAADVFQEAFIKIFKNLHQVRDPLTLGGWIKRLTVNVALDHLKKTRYDHSMDSVGHELSDDFYGDLLDRLSNDAIVEVINRLPSGYRVIFNMNVIDGYSHKEIGEELGITESTSRSQLTHAKRLLRKYLNEIGIKSYEQVV